MQIRIIFYLFLFGIGLQNKSFAIIPHPDHVVVLILENTSYSEIVGSAAAPYINSLINDPKCALFTQSYGLTRPSQPNYLQLFSGSTQGVTSNNLPFGLPFTTPNLGAQLLGASKSFVGYSETMPYAGYTGEVSGTYARKHNPWVNWQGSITNGIPATLNETFLAFPSSANYSSLPHLSIVVPNEDNDMHNGNYPARITTGDTWVQNNLDAYIQWAKTHNSLFILTFDEDNYVDQHIVTLFIGPMVNHGSYSNYINHYSVLRLMEDMFNLPRIGGAAAAAPIDYCWSTCYQLSNITESGPTTFCQGGSITLTAAGGSSFLWSTGATTQMITVNSSGNYSVTINDGAGCTSTSSTVNVTVNSFNYSANVFSETMGIVSNTTLIPTYETSNGFDNDNLLMTGTGDVRKNTNSTGYTTASGEANVFLTNTIGKYFQIENINTTSLANLQLSFGIYKNSNAATGTDLLVQYSLDGTNYTSLAFDPLPVGNNTAIWYYRTCTGLIPTGNNLRIKFIQNGTVAQYRIDDVLLKYTQTVPQISANGPVNFCLGGNVTLSASTAGSYLWSTGASTQSIIVSSSGNYHVVETGGNVCTATSNIISVNADPVPVVNSFTPANGSPGIEITINGSEFIGITSVEFNGISASFTIINSNQITAWVPPGSASGPITITNNCSSGISPQPFIVDIVSSVFELKLFIEGYYAGNSQMCAYLGGVLCDSVTVELRSAVSPYNVVYSLKEIINTTGMGIFSFPSSANGNSFYISVFGKNSLMTWSSIPLIFSSSTNYDFTIFQNQAYGSNLKNLGDGNFALFSGDVNSDGFINLLDHSAMINSIQGFNTGYNKYDLNCDSMDESLDFCILENNLNVVSLHP